MGGEGYSAKVDWRCHARAAAILALIALPTAECKP